MAAFLVVISHVRHIVLVDYTTVEQKSILVQGLYFFTGLGHEAVVIFFVISGFLVGGLTLEKWRTQGVRIGEYFAARISRIYVVLIPALIFGLILDAVGLHWFNGSELYSNGAQYRTNSLNEVFSNGMDARTLFGNIFMMQGVLTKTLGSNGPLWSLAFEWWYYVIFIVFALAIEKSNLHRFGYICLALIISVLLPQQLILWGAIWMLGVLAKKCIDNRVVRLHPVFGIVIFLVALGISRISHSVENFREPTSIALTRDLFLGLAYVAAIVSVGNTRINIFTPKCNKWLADFSYTTYLFHFPAMIFIVAFAAQVFHLDFQLQPRLFGLTYMATIVFILYIYCYVFSLLTERHTRRMRSMLTTIMLSNAWRWRKLPRERH